MSRRADYIGWRVCESLTEEVTTTPKPGLVDLNNTGSHTDLSVELFFRSIAALRPSFTQIARLSLSWERPVGDLFGAIRAVGIVGEQRMFEATGGVNTHKGALFSLGILGGATAYAASHALDLDPFALCALVGDMTHPTLEAELSALKHERPTTHGQRIFQESGNRGIRGEVMDGFPTIRARVLPLFKEFSYPLTMRDKLVILLSIMAELDDTNIVSRGGAEGLAYVKRSAQDALDRRTLMDDASFMHHLMALDSQFIARNLSSGGAADLLAVSIYLHAIGMQPAVCCQG